MTDVPVPPGWYPYPGGDGALRWWDGSQWREPEPPAVQQPLPEGVTTNTWAFWVMAVVLPALGVVENVVLLASGLYGRILSGSFAARTIPISGTGDRVQVRTFVPTPAYETFTLVSYAAGLVLIIASGLLALRDQRILRDRGVVKPFPWGWGFLNIVYVIGRSVVVRRRLHASLLPLWLFVTLLVISLVLSGIATGSALAEMFSSIGALAS